MKSILITGGSGSFGTAFAKKLLEGNEYGRICIYSRGEQRQAEMAEVVSHDPRLRFFIGDIRDRRRLTRALVGVDVLVHAAALKRIEVGHYNPTEMVRTNILGAMNVVEAAQDAQVKKVVFLSTDKAYQPISPYGQSKALAERIFLAANTGKSRFAVTRYGNVWKSAGSVVPLWQAILASGSRTVPVTNYECTRFFMRMREAIHLVLQTITTMPAEPAIPELPAYRLGDLATAIGAVPEIIGLPEWEKMHESMCEGQCSKDARRMTVEELRAEL